MLTLSSLNLFHLFKSILLIFILMNKSIQLLVVLLGINVFAGAQAINPLLAGRLQQIIDSVRIANNYKGVSAAIIFPTQGSWQGVSGISHPGTLISPGMAMGIASNTKLFTAVLLLKLAENNLIRLDDSLHSYLPAYPNINPDITIRQLLNQTSGLDDVTHIPGYGDSMLSNPNRIFTAAEMMAWAGPPLFAPGTDWNYCNTNYLLAAMIAEQVTGRSYSALLRDSILTPLQLDSTYLDVYETGLSPIANPWQAGVNNMSIPRTSVNSAAWSAGAMYSTATEMTQWYQALLNGDVLSPASLTEMTTFVGSGDYGMGIARGTVNNRIIWYHGGQIWGGYNSSMMYDPATGIIIAVLINQLPAQAYQLAFQLLFTLVEFPVGMGEVGSYPAEGMLYPNPAGDWITIPVSSAASSLLIQVYDVTGVLMKETTETQFSVAGLPKGIYMVSVHGSNGSVKHKLLKQ